MAKEPTEGEWAAIEEEIFAGRMIQAVKLYRAASGLGLKEAKDGVEGRERGLREKWPEKFVAGPGGKGGCLGVVMVVVGLVGAGWVMGRWG